ncbi:family 3 adenylate cyclase [Synechococcus sp. PCC 7502]|uniref:adenylate/guanylate cyclase domain-containing protein n=1 Tax=Synechococcus sp. PCC 7502 TaxID=1173263 RepID=UPI00029F9076|nr:adenylate/guanylate cyclase domain-containing protein [Synechococcus sp. PCC 7502]AFY73970.1 family 3 adenylate cyclase [Synechococcus sp. PCC 7502]
MPYLIRKSEQPDQEIIQLKLGLNRIGRDRSSDIVETHTSLSRQHATIEVTNDHIILTDLQSLNGSYVNGDRVSQYYLQDQDSIRCGDIVFKYRRSLNEIASNTVINTEHQHLNILERLSPEATSMNTDNLLQKKAHLQGMLHEQDLNLRSRNKLQIILEVSKQLSSPQEPQELLEKVLELIFKIMNVDRAAILIINESSNELEEKAVRARTGNHSQFYSKKITNFVREQGDAILTSDALFDQRFSSSESVYAQTIHASMCVPLKPKSKVIGVLYVDNLSVTNIYTAEDLEFLTALASQAAICIENANLYKKIEAEAIMRNKFERFFSQSVIRKLKEEEELGIIETEATSLFCDISNYTEMSATIEPHQVIAMLNEYFEVMAEGIVFQYEGTLEKYIGDALLSVWGAPYPSPDDADRAVAAAIAMQFAMQDLNAQWMRRYNLPGQIHIGLNTGRVAAGNIGSSRLIQYATIGDTTNVTSRICNIAKAGEIMLSQSTVDKLIQKNLPLEKMAPVLVKGKSQPIQIYRLNWQDLKHSVKAVN